MRPAPQTILPIMYTQKSDLVGKMPESWLDEAVTDKNGDTPEAVFALAVTAAQREIDGLLGQRYAVPFADGHVPSVVKAASDAFTLYNLYARRGVADENNPHAKNAEFWRTKLAAIGAGTEPLSPEHKKSIGSVQTVGIPAKAFSKHKFNS